jgi:hypothetical protein
MLIDVANFGRRCAFTAEAIDALQQAAVRLEANGCMLVFKECRAQLFLSKGDPWQKLDALAYETRVHKFTVHQLFLIYCAEETKNCYKKAKYPEDIYWDSMQDLKYKMEETHRIYGVWGVYCGPWLASFILMKCFCLGRLQFEILPCEFHYELAGHTLHPHAPVVNVHIPSFGKLNYEDVLDAYSRAAEFFGHLFPDGAVWFHCESWMLYPEVNALLPAGNIKRFSEDFDIVHACIDPSQDDRYRVFMLPPDVPIAEYPEKNTLQRSLKSWLLAGNTMGVGSGLFLWKNGKIVPHKK